MSDQLVRFPGTSWDEIDPQACNLRLGHTGQLAVAMWHYCVRIEEDLVLDTLLYDLTTGFVGPQPQGLEGLPNSLCAESRQ